VFSKRLKWDAHPNPISRLRGELCASGIEILDLTESNPTHAGLDYPEGLLSPLADAKGLTYNPDPRGIETARRAVSAYYESHRVEIPPDRILLTASTSEAYSYLFKLLADPGDEVLAPRPSYPLFEFLASLESVHVRQYPLRYDGSWHIDFDALQESVTPRTRAVIVVNPNNPTGSYLTMGERQRLEAFCALHDLALISDEVFCDYELTQDSSRPLTLAGRRKALTFSLSGLSKGSGLPQLKLGWMVVSGPDAAAACERLEWISDTFLSVSTPMQVALPRLLEAGAAVRSQILQRTGANLLYLQERLLKSTMNLRSPQGGWYAVLQVPSIRTEEEWVLELLREHHVLVQPGFFYDFESEAFLVLSLLTPPAAFREGVERLFRMP
jgi:aspartate/methionine/tyrosine aminotransferase